ncbi:MFS transporter [Levilactobacillus hammesii]|uniref:MDR-type permease n=1 Tax=Levilactobacillus hammesii DSM 16381 TaxID=1423753 RepID=A0A0R1URM8_9LACO|nr:MFS transporter [Levilactobacillus hammesii]KRL95855.1 MDR-type permease [Levilactobacillus hammesii DSM 16381]
MGEKLRGKLGLSALCLIMFMVTLDTTITNIALPDITKYFNASLTTTNWISTIYVLAMSVFIIPAAKFGDQFGRKKIMLLGLALFGIGSLLCGLSENLIFLIAVRFMQGIGGAIVTPIMIPLSVSLFGRKKATDAVGTIGAVTAVAAAAGPPIGGVILQYFAWKYIFFINIPIVVLTFILMLICFNESYDQTISKRIDVLGLSLFLTGIAQLTYVLIKGYDLGWFSQWSIGLMIGSVLCIGLFVWWEKHTQTPFIEFDLFKESTFTASSLVYFVCGFAIICSSLIFNFYLENVRAYTALKASYVIMFMSITVMVVMPLGTKLQRKLGYKPLITAGIVLMGISLLMLTRLSQSTSWLAMVLMMIILGSGFGLGCLTIVSAVQFIPQDKAGMASGIVNASRQLGTCLGIALLVGTMTHTTNLAKSSIKRDSNTAITRLAIPKPFSTTIKQDLNQALNSETTYDLQAKLKTDLKKDQSQPYANGQPQNSNLKRLYNGTQAIKDAYRYVNKRDQQSLERLISGQKKMRTAMVSSQDTQYQLLFELIKGNVNGVAQLATYENDLKLLSQSSETAANVQKQQLLAMLIAVYRVGLNPTVQTVSQFKAQIERLSPNTQSLLVGQQQLLAGQMALLTGLKKSDHLLTGLDQIQTGLSDTDLERRVTSYTQTLRNSKNTHLTTAFTDTFLVAAIFILLFTIAGMYTDRTGEFHEDDTLSN